MLQQGQDGQSHSRRQPQKLGLHSPSGRMVGGQPAGGSPSQESQGAIEAPPQSSQSSQQIPQQNIQIQGPPQPGTLQHSQPDDRRRGTYLIDPTIGGTPHPGSSPMDYRQVPHQIPLSQGIPAGMPQPGTIHPGETNFMPHLPVPMMMNPGLQQPPPMSHIGSRSAPLPPGQPPLQSTLPPMPTIAFNALPPLPSQIKTPERNRSPIETGDSALTLLPEEQRAIGHGARRPFQPRRRSRACDACRTRKTKCDTPDNGPCASCVAASLVCKFSEGGDERRRAGPTRKARELETENRELKKEIERYREKIVELMSTYPQGGPKFPPAPYPMQGVIAEPSQYPPVMPPMTMSGGMTPQRNFATMRTGGEVPNLGANVPIPEDSVLDPFQRRQSASNSDSSDMTIRGQGGDGSWAGQHFGSTSVPTFALWYRGYMEYMGYNPPNDRTFTQDIPNLYLKPIRGTENEYQFPLLSDYPALSYRPGPTYDLRGFLPSRDVADRLKQAFWNTIQQYTPIMHWLKLESRFNRAYSEPLWETDRTGVREIFCIVMMVLAVSSQFLPECDVQDPNGGQRAMRNGWKYFELARKYHGLNNPVYTVGDAIITVLMSIYLDNASLPSPAWMMVGAMARICQDIGLHKRQRRISREEAESRKRLFWGAYILDQKIALVLGRPSVFRNAGIEVGLPDSLDIENDQSIACPPVVEEGWNGGQRGLETLRANAYVCRYFEAVSNVEITATGSQEDMQKLLSIDAQLKRGWEIFPADLTDPQSREPIDVPAIRPLINAQHARLSLFRWFCDFSRDYQPYFRKFCLKSSVLISKFTAHLLHRASLSPTFETDFAMRTNDLVHIHAFRAAAVLLLQFSIKDTELPPVNYQELFICVRALKAAANRHPAASRYLELFNLFSRTFRIPANSPSSQQGSSPVPPKMSEGDFNPNFNVSTHSGSSPFPVSPQGQVYQDGLQTEGSGGEEGGSGEPNVSAQTQGMQGVGNDGIDWSTLREMMELDAGFGNMMTNNPPQMSTAAPTPGVEPPMGSQEGILNIGQNMAPPVGIQGPMGQNLSSGLQSGEQWQQMDGMNTGISQGM